MNELGIATEETGSPRSAEGGERQARFKAPQDLWIARLPREDFCQALGIAPDRTFERDGGPSVRDCLGVLANSEQADEDRATLALAQLAFWLLATTDGHAKNFSIQHRRGDRFHLTTLYDVLYDRISVTTTLSARSTYIGRPNSAGPQTAGGRRYRASCTNG